MRNKLFGAILAPISIIGLTFALGIGATAFGTPPSTGELQQSDGDTLISTLNVTTQVEVAPWCGWYVSTSGVTALALAPDASLIPAAPTEYIGTEIALTATAAENTAYVGPASELTYLRHSPRTSSSRAKRSVTSSFQSFMNIRI